VNASGEGSKVGEGKETRLRVGVIGCGLIAQVMHLPHLRDLHDLFEIDSICDISPSVLAAVGEEFGVSRRFTRWQDVLAERPDAVLVLTPGSHAPMVAQALREGIHVFVEKPLCYSVMEGKELLAAAEDSGAHGMVGYMKRYDPAFERLLTEMKATDDLRLVRVTTLESPIAPYVLHHPLIRANDAPREEVEALEADAESRARSALGTDDPALVRVYRAVLLDGLVHELNLLRATLGEPDELVFTSLHESEVTLVLSFGDVRCVVCWVDLPGIARYEQEFAFYAPDRRLVLRFPSPFLRNMPTHLALEGGEVGTARSWANVETASYEEAFKSELREFYGCVVEDREPRTPIRDALRDVALCQSIVMGYRQGGVTPRPSSLEMHLEGGDVG
jgi:predicted dehydrogenase